MLSNPLFDLLMKRTQLNVSIDPKLLEKIKDHRAKLALLD